MPYPTKIIRVLIADTAIALVVPFLELTFNPATSFHRMLTSFGFSAIYSNTIGGLANIMVPKMWPVMGRYKKPIRWILRVAVLIAIAIAGSLISDLVFIALGWIPAREFRLEFSSSLKIAILLTLAIGLTVSVYEGLRAQLQQTTLQLRTKELERERALKLATEAQLASLESRIHPHFLFNTINSISSLIPEDPIAAERLMERMAALLRFSLDAKQSGLVSLENEMKIVTDYLEIEKVRFGKRLEFCIEVPAELNQAQVPPLSVQSLVENSVKYAIAPNRAGGEVRIRGVRTNGCVYLEVADTGPGFELASAPAGHGIDNLQGRLATIFGPQASLTMAAQESGAAVVMSIPQCSNTL